MPERITMRIKFKAGDPRAGTVAQMDSHRGQELIDSGAAVKVKEDGTDHQVAAAPSPDHPVTGNVHADQDVVTSEVVPAPKPARTKK